MPAKYIIRLTSEERQMLHAIVTKGIGSARKLNHARILLKADASADGPNWTDEAISNSCETSICTIRRVRRRFVEESLQAALVMRPVRQQRKRSLDGEQEAHLVALVCGAAPAGRARWSLRLLADRMVTLGYVEHVSHETVRQTLGKNELKPWLKEEWCIPPQQNAEFVCHMEEVLDVYTLPYDPDYPQVCMDELCKPLIGEKRQPIPAEPGQPQRYDYEYERLGVCNIFILFEALQAKRFLLVTDHRTMQDWAHLIQYLVDVLYPHAKRIRLVLDNLNTHVGAALYATFPPAEAKRILQRLELHYTPKHGSWLNMAEIELSVLSRQCLDRRLDDKTTLAQEVSAWMNDRNAHHFSVDWRFTTDDARIKLKRLYPSILP